MFPLIADPGVFSKASSTVGFMVQRQILQGNEKIKCAQPTNQEWCLAPAFSPQNAEGRWHFASPAPFYHSHRPAYLLPWNLGALTVTRAIKGLKSSEELYVVKENRKTLLILQLHSQRLQTESFSPGITLTASSAPFPTFQNQPR